MVQKLNAKALAYALAIFSAAFMLILSVLAALGVYPGAAEQMISWHMFYSLTVVGTITGMIEGAIHGLVYGWFIAWVYNKLI